MKEVFFKALGTALLSIPLVLTYYIGGIDWVIILGITFIVEELLRLRDFFESND
jgi:hypothetical protein